MADFTLMAAFPLPLSSRCKADMNELFPRRRKICRTEQPALVRHQCLSLGYPLVVDPDGYLSMRSASHDQLGRCVTSPEAQELARMANGAMTENPARAVNVDITEFHPAWHAVPVTI